MVGPVHAVDRPVPAARDGRGARRRSTSSSSARPAARCSPALLADAFGPRAAVLVHRRPVDDHRRLPDHPRARGSSATTSRWWSPSCRRRWPSTSASSRRRTTVPALQVVDIDFSYGPVQVLFDVGLRGAARRGARAARHQRRGQVDDPARDRRPRHTRTRRRAPQRPHHHLHHAGAARAPRHPHPARRQGRVPGDDGPREPRDGGVRLPRRRRRRPASARPRLDLFPALRASGATLASTLSGGQQQMLALAHGAAARPRGARHRRALARARAARRAGAARGRSSGSRPRG